MLILLLRTIFVVLALLVGHVSLQANYRSLGDAMPSWFGAAMGFGIAVTLIAAEQAFRRRFTRSLVAVLVGLACGLALSWLLVSVLHLIVGDESQWRNLDLPCTLFLVYLVMITVLRNVDRLRLILPFVEMRSEQVAGGDVILDGAVLGDSRIPALLRTGFFGQRVVVHRSSLSAWELEQASHDPVRVAKAQRALDGLRELRLMTMPRVEVDDAEVPNAVDQDDTLIRLCRMEGARLLTGDRERARRAAAEGVEVIDLAGLAQVLVPLVKPGESIEVVIDRQGEARGQGIGFLDDGSMVVVNGAGDLVGQRIVCTVMRIHTTSNGRMVFAEPAKG